MRRRLQDVREVFTSLVEQTNKVGLEINKKKRTKFVTVSRKLYNENDCIKLDSCSFEIVEDCTDCGTIITNKN